MIWKNKTKYGKVYSKYSIYSMYSSLSTYFTQWRLVDIEKFGFLFLPINIPIRCLSWPIDHSVSIIYTEYGERVANPLRYEWC